MSATQIFKRYLLICIFLILAIMIFGPVSFAQTGALKLKTTENVVYGSSPTVRGNKRLLLDFFAPDAPCTSLRPTVLMIHGGGFKTGSRRQKIYRKFARTFAAKGWNSASISYRLQKDKPLVSNTYLRLLTGDENNPKIAYVAAGAVEDARKALAFLANQEQGCIDSDRIAVLGASAGAMIALNLAYALDDANIDAPAVVAVVNFWGALQNTDTIGQNDVPMFIAHGTADELVSFKNAQALVQRGFDTDTKVQLHAFKGKDHGYFYINPYRHLLKGELLVDVLLTFLDSVFSDPVLQIKP